MYDISGLNTLSELDDLLVSIDQVLSSKGVDPDVRKICLATKKEILQKIAKINKQRRRDGL